MDINKKAKEILNELGLSENEVQLYLALLPAGKLTVGELVKRAKTNRSNTYFFLQSLQEKGLVEIDRTTSVLSVIANDPAQLSLIAEKNQNKFARLKHKIQDDFLPEFGALYNQQLQKPKIRYYFGKEHYLRIQDETLVEKEILILVSMADFYHVIPWEEDEQYFYKRVHRGTVARIIGPDDPYIRKQAAAAKEFLREIRILPKNFKHAFHGTCIIFGQKVVFYTFREDLMAVVIESKDITDILKTVFWLSWEKAIPI